MERLEQLVRGLVGETVLQQIKDASYEADSLTQEEGGGNSSGDDFAWTTAGDTSVIHIAKIGSGAFGEVHKVISRYLIGADASTQLLNKTTGQVIASDSRRNNF